MNPQGAFNPPPAPDDSFPSAPLPPFMPMPPMMPMFPPPRRNTFTRGIFVTLATTIFGMSLIANVYLLLAGGLLGGGVGPLESAMKEGSAEQKVVVLPIHGMIDAGTVTEVTPWFKKIEQDPNVKAVVIQVDTPGGTVGASDELYHQIERLKKTRNIPVAVSMRGMATSGGYYISCAADRIFAQPTTWTGNIGVLWLRFNFSAMTGKWGIQETTITAPTDGYKHAGSPFSPEDPRSTAYLRGLVDDAYKRFSDLVAQGRKGKLKGNLKDICNGQVYTAQQALALGLIDDANAYLDDACKWAADQAKLTNPMYVRYQRRPSVLETFLASDSSAGRSPPGGVNVHIDGKIIDELTAPRLMYLWRGD